MVEEDNDVFTILYTYIYKKIYVQLYIYTIMIYIYIHIRSIIMLMLFENQTLLHCKIRFMLIAHSPLGRWIFAGFAVPQQRLTKGLPLPSIAFLSQNIPKLSVPNFEITKIDPNIEFACSTLRKTWRLSQISTDPEDSTMALSPWPGPLLATHGKKMSKRLGGNGGFQKWVYPNSWMVYNGKSY